jgi:hypothetical protein
MHSGPGRPGRRMRQMSDETPRPRVGAELARLSNSLAVVDPTIEAAWIGAAIGGGVGVLGIVGAVVTSVVSSNNTKKATEQTVAGGTTNTVATLAAAREDRLWEKRAAAYEETLTGLLHRQAQRHFELRKYREDNDTEKKLQQFYENYELPGLFETQGRLVAYASDVVMDAFNASRGAHAHVRVQYAHRAALRESARLAQETGRLEGVPDAGTMLDAGRQLDGALEAADAADDALIKVIRDELRSKPEAATLPAPVPVVRRRFLRRH